MFLRYILYYLIACAKPLTITLEATVVDECAGACFVVEGSSGQDGRVCTGPLAPGVQTLTFEDGDRVATATVDVRPFGYDYGLDRPSAHLATVPWTPIVEGLADGPILEGDPDAWDASSVMAPATIGWGDEQLLFYAGTAQEHYALGLATRTSVNGPYEKYEGNPILWPGPPGTTDGSWKNWAQNTPEPEVVGDELWLYYNGQGVSDGRLSIGLAVGSDPRALVDIDANPVLAGTGNPDDWDGRGVAHPSVVQRDGVFELWYASGTDFALGYAVSSDGVEFERYCNNPVFSGQGAQTWDRGHVKAPEVWFDEGDETYFMTYSGCDKGCYQVGWAASSDGLRWVAAPEPVVPSGQADWSAQATREAYLAPHDGTLGFVFTGNDGDIERIGQGHAPLN